MTGFRRAPWHARARSTLLAADSEAGVLLWPRG